MNNQKKNQEITALLSAWFNLAGTNKATMLKGCKAGRQDHAI
jgi:hypothetical protein